MRALIAEDNEDYRNLVRLLLERKGFEVIAVHNGHDALEEISNLLIAGQDPPRVIFLASKMPGINGMEVLKRVRKFPGDVKHAYVLITGTIEASVLNDAIADGADDFVSKNLGTKLLEMKLNAAARFATLFEQHHV